MDKNSFESNNQNFAIIIGCIRTSRKVEKKPSDLMPLAFSLFGMELVG